MSAPYVTPADLLGDPSPPPTINTASDAATLGVNFQTISPTRLWEMCKIATVMCDSIAGFSLRAVSQYEENVGPGHRLGLLNDSAARFITSRKPILSVISGQYSYGGPPFSWVPITPTYMAPETPPMELFGSTSWSGAGAGQAAILIGLGGVPMAGGRNNTRVGIRYIAGWPVANVDPAATTNVTLIAGNASGTVASGTGIANGAPVEGQGIALNTTVTISGTAVTLSQPALTTGTFSMTVGYPAGVTTMNVDDVTAWGAGVTGSIYDGIYTESVDVTTASATMAGLPAPAGPGTVTFAAPTMVAHLPGCNLSAMSHNIRWAAMLGVKIQVLERGGQAIAATRVPGQAATSTRSHIADTHTIMRELLAPFKRTY